MTPPPTPNPLADDLDDILSQTSGLWENLRGQSIFVTGGTGFFGRWLLESFAHANRQLSLDASMVVLSRNPAAFADRAANLASDPAIHLVAGDVRRFTAESILAQLGKNAPHGFTAVIHAATDTNAQTQAADPLLVMETVVDGTRAALDFAVSTGAKRFLLTSSGAVYGPQPGALSHVPEDYLGGPDYTRPSSAYAESKRVAELLCAYYREKHGLEPLIARCFAFVGPHLPLDGHFAVGNFLRDALGNGPIRVSGDGSPYRSYLYAADLAVWLWTILLRGAPMQPYNVGSPHALSILELARTVLAALAVPGEVLVARARQAGALPTRYVPDVSRAESELRLRARTSLPDAIRRTARWASAHDPCVARTGREGGLSRSGKQAAG